MTTSVADPIALLHADRSQAAASGDPMASLCMLATVDGGEPQARTLVLRDVEARLAVFFNRTSPKYREIAQSATVAVVVYLPSRSVQYRLRCRLEPIPAAIVGASWQLRPPVPKRMDWLYEDRPQSTAIDSREQFAALLDGRREDAAPDSAVGYYLAPATIERLHLDQPDGIHDRRRYTPGADGWHEEVLVP